MKINQVTEEYDRLEKERRLHIEKSVEKIREYRNISKEEKVNKFNHLAGVIDKLNIPDKTNK